MFTESSMIKTLAFSNQEIKLVKNDMPIFQPEDAIMRITETVGFSPTRELFSKKGESIHHLQSGVEVKFDIFKLRQTSPTINAVLLGKATKEDLAMFACIADPDLYVLPTIQTAIMDRLSSIHAEEAARTIGDLTEVHQAERALFTERAGLFTNTQTKDCETFYHEGYNPTATHKTYAELRQEQEAAGVERIEIVSAVNPIETLEG